MKAKLLFIFLLIIIAFGCTKKAKDCSSDADKMSEDSLSAMEEGAIDQSAGLQIIERLSQLYGEDPRVIGDFIGTPKAPDFLEGHYFDGSTLVFQVRGDTTKARQTLEAAAASNAFTLELITDSIYSQKQLHTIMSEMNERLEEARSKKGYRNFMAGGVEINTIFIHLIVNTPSKRKEFREKVMDSPAFRFYGVEAVINEQTGINDTLGVHIHPEQPFYPTSALQAHFTLRNNSGSAVSYGAQYHVTYKDSQGVWRELPINKNFNSLLYGLNDKKEARLAAELFPDIHPNKAGKYRYFLEITINKKDYLFMSEFTLSDKE